MQRRTVLASGVVMAASMVIPPRAASGFYVPAEEAPHQRTFMQWPVNRQVYPDAVFLRRTQQTIADIANAIVAFEPVTMLTTNLQEARRLLSAAVDLWDLPTDDLWCRDAGPLFAINGEGELALSHIQFNGWGGKQDSTHDALIATQVAQRLGLRILPSGLVLAALSKTVPGDCWHMKARGLTTIAIRG